MCEGIARSFLYITNLLVFLLACVVLGLSIWIVVDAPSFVDIADSVGVNIVIYDTGCYVLIAISSLVIIVTFLGCCGAAKHSRCLLVTYFICVLTLLIGIAIGAYFVLSGNIDTLKKPFYESMSKYNPNGKSSEDRTLVQMWDDWQQSMKCCGVDTYKDWAEYDPDHFTPYNQHSITDPIFRPDASRQPSVPASCCDPQKRLNECEPISSRGIYLTGCFQAMLDEIETNSAIVGGVAIGVLVVMIVNGIIALYMSTCGYHSSRPKHYYARTATSDQL